MSSSTQISNLPDCIISHILSCLPTKDAVRTSVFSKDWKYKWTSIQDIKICDREYKLTKATFVNFVERILVQLQNLESFHLSCYGKYNSEEFKSLISAALSRDVQSLQIFYTDPGMFFLFQNLLNSYSLRKLVLDMHWTTMKLHATNCLPHLTTLHLVRVAILNELSNSHLVKLNFPVLETFVLIECKWLNVKFVEIYAPKMTRFKSETPSRVNDYSIKITGDSLVRFISRGRLPENIVLSGSPDVYAAHLQNRFRCDDVCIHEKSGLQIRKLLKAFSSLVELELSGSVAKAIALSKLQLPLPTYYKMERLVLETCANTKALFELLDAAPCLKFLKVVYVLWWKDYDYDAEEFVPSCIVSHLEEVEFGLFTGSINELKLVKFFMKNALQLKSIRVNLYPPMQEKEQHAIEQELWTYPSASSASLNIDITMSAPRIHYYNSYL